MNKIAMANCVLLIFIFTLADEILGVLFWAIILAIILVIDKTSQKGDL